MPSQRTVLHAPRRRATPSHLRTGPWRCSSWTGGCVGVVLYRYDEASADATAALALDIPAGLAQKARYRRALARRGLGDLDGAKADLEGVLRVDPGNAEAKREMEEVVGELRGREEKRAEAEAKANSAGNVGKQPARTPNSSALLDEQLGSGFTALRTRQRPSYVNKAGGGRGEGGKEPAAATTATAAATTAATSSSNSSPPIPPNPSSTAPGAGLALLRKLSALPQPQRSAYLQHYTPEVIAQIVDPVLEPDGLGVLLASIADSQDDAWARKVILGLKHTRRWKMNMAMLSRAERQLGLDLCSRLGVEL